MFSQFANARIYESDTVVRPRKANSFSWKCAYGDHPPSGQKDPEPFPVRRSLQEGERDRTKPRKALSAVHDVLRTPGASLDLASRDFMESRFAYGFSHVRVHTDDHAAESAQELDASAYTVGPHIVFNTDQYKPQTAHGKRLLAHELVHVMQQSGHTGHPRLLVGDPSDQYEEEADQLSNEVTNMVSRGTLPERTAVVSRHPGAVSGILQRAGFWETIVRFFGGGTFSEEELCEYLETLDRTRNIEGRYDSDNKAREIVRRWQRGDPAFSVLHVPRRILLIQEMLAGFTGDADEQAILALLREATTSERTAILNVVGLSNIRSNLHGNERRQFEALHEEHEIESLPTLGRWTPEGVMEILHRHGDEIALRTILEGHYRIMRFSTVYVTWEYTDGRREEKEFRGLRGMTCRAQPHTSDNCPREKEIWVLDRLTNEIAASTLFHESEHIRRGPSGTDAAYLEQEIQVRIATEEFRIRHGIRPTMPGYRNPDGTINVEKIRQDVVSGPSSQAYRPQGREIVAMRFVPDDQVVAGWRLP